jgi:hypothetical protein
MKYLKILSTKIPYFHGTSSEINGTPHSPFWLTNAKEMARKFCDGGFVYRFQLLRPAKVFHYRSEGSIDKAIGRRFPQCDSQTEHNRLLAELLSEAGYKGYF